MVVPLPNLTSVPPQLTTLSSLSLHSLFCCVLKVDSVIDICSEVMNLRSVSYECKKKLEEIKDDYKIEVRLNVKRHI